MRMFSGTAPGALRLAGSDAHARTDIATCATRFERDISTIEELIAELKAGRFQAVDLSLATTPASGGSADQVQGGSAKLEQDAAPTY